MMKWQAVTFYTRGTPYEQEVGTLLESCAKFAIDCEAVAVDPLGSWWMNTTHRVRVIREAWENYPGRAIVCLDADAVLANYPAEFDAINADFAACWLNNRELFLSVSYWSPTPPARELLSRWHALMMDGGPKNLDQWYLQRAVERDTPEGLRVHKLSPEYGKIFDRFHNVSDPVIIHNQASRRFKSAVSTGAMNG